MLVEYMYSCDEYYGVNKKRHIFSGKYQCEDVECEKLFELLRGSSYIKLKKFWIFKGEYQYIWNCVEYKWKKFKR